MASIPNGFPISLRSWPSKSTDTTDLPTFFQRINIERGGLINVNEENLQDEIAREAAGHVEDESSEDEEEKGTDEVKARAAAREELLQHISTANQSAMFQLEFISLLLSKENPGTASQSISPHLRERVGLGTLGASKATSLWTSAEQREDNKLVARGWKTTDVNKTIDSILASATRLETEIQKETRYWEELLDLNEQGWNICKFARRQGHMGVRLGSREVSPVLRNQGLAMLSRNESGSLYLSPDPITADPKVLRIRIQVDGKITGTSPVPMLVPTTGSIQALLHQTRNTLTALELWHELNRESRNLGSFSISIKGQDIIFPLAPNKSAILDLFSLSERQQEQPGADDTLAYVLNLSLQHLLCYSHRQSLRRRSHPQKPKANPKKGNPAEAVRNKLPTFSESPTLLRPLLTASNHHTALSQTHTLFHLLANTVRKASLPYLPTYTIVNIPPNLPPYLSNAERVISTLTNHLSTLVTVQLTPDTELKIMLRTAINLPATIFTIQVAPDTSELARICPPPINTPLLFEQMEAYVLFLTATAIAQQFISNSTNTADTNEEDSPAEPEGWHRTHHPSTLKYTSPSTFDPSDPEIPATIPTSEKILSFTLQTLPVSASTSPNLPTQLTDSTPQTSSRKGLKLLLTYGQDSTFESAGFKALTDDVVLGEMVDAAVANPGSGKGRKKDDEKGEGRYEWVVWDGEEVGDQLVKEDKEDVKKIEDVVGGVVGGGV